MKYFYIVFGIICICLVLAIAYYYKSIRMVLNEKVTIKTAALDFEEEAEKMFVYSFINGKKYKFQLDTGATQHFIFDEAFKDEESTGAGYTVLANGSKIKSSPVSLNLENNLLSGKPLIVQKIRRNINPCNKSAGFFSLTNFIDEERLVALNFSKKQIYILDQFINTQNFQKTDLEVDLLGIIKVKLLIDGKYDWYIFDTGATTTIVNNYDYPNAKKSVYKVLKDNGEQKNIIKYRDVPIQLGQKEYLTDIHTSEGINRKLVGFSFIKNFDWILDFKNNLIYFKERSNNQPIKSYDFKYTCRVYEKSLTIGAKDLSAREYNIGQQILSVNGTPITSENLCQYQKLLNETENWDTLKLVVR